MRLLLLALTVLVFLPQVIPDFSGKKCWQNLGRCRKNCNVDQEIITECKNHRVCCVPKSTHKEKVPINTEVPTTSFTTLFDFNTEPMDFYVSIPPSVPDFEVNVIGTESAISDRALETKVSLPQVH
uniref:Beta-defensin n=1 Tax=Molossus molossus TaxID=27622 RepID=A0A7J8HFL2_MOLMO|nr:defensin beta 118 [Molossus molossus]